MDSDQVSPFLWRDLIEFKIPQDILDMLASRNMSSLSLAAASSAHIALSEWSSAGLNVATAVKRGVYTVHESLVIKVIGKLADVDAERLEQSGLTHRHDRW